MGRHIRHEGQFALDFDVINLLSRGAFTDDSSAADPGLDPAFLDLDQMIANFEMPSFLRVLPGYHSLKTRPRELDTLDKIEWIECVGADVLERALLSYPLSMLEKPCRIREAIPSSDPAIQRIWMDMRYLMQWSDDQIRTLRTSIMETQLEMIHSWYTSGHEAPSEDVRDIWRWLEDASEHPFSSKSLFTDHGLDHEEVASEVRYMIRDRFEQLSA